MLNGPEDRFCRNCGAPFETGAAACARCGRLRERARETVTMPARGMSWTAAFVGGILSGVGVFLVYGFVLLLISSSFSRDPVALKTQFNVENFALTALLCAASLIGGVVLAKRGRPAIAIFIIVAAFVGLVPASLCTYGFIGSGGF